MKVTLKVPKAFKTAKYVLGVDVEGKETIEVEKNLVADFLKLGFEEVKEKKSQKKKDEE